jgi:plastocyanin
MHPIASPTTARRIRPNALRAILVASSTILALAVAGCASDDPLPSADGGSESSGSPAVISIESFDFGDPITITAGTAVLVQNLDGVGHTWTADDGESFMSGFLEPGDEFRQRLDAPGTITFACEIHPSMTGSITVVGD